MDPERACPREVDCVAWLQGELEAAPARSFAAHLARCDRCQRTLAESAHILRGLTHHGVRSRRRALLSRVALVTGGAAAALGLSLWLGATDAPPPEPPATVQAVDRLGLELDAEGNWDPSSWASLGAGQDVGAHAFTLLALTRGVAAEPEAHRLARVSRAARGLLARQGEDGRFTSVPGSQRFDQPVATLALLEAWRVTADPRLAAGARRAVAVLLEDEARERAGPNAQAGHGAWVLAGLVRAQQLGLGGADTSAALARAARDAPQLFLGDGDLLDQQQFWALALGPRRAASGADDLFGTSAELLTER